MFLNHYFLIVFVNTTCFHQIISNYVFKRKLETVSDVNRVRKLGVK